MRWSGFDLLLALWVGFVAGINEPPWHWETWAVMGVFVLYVVLKMTRDKETPNE